MCAGVFGVRIAPMEVRYSGGVHLPEADLWLDPRRVKPFAFVSHAHSDHLRPHLTVLASEATAALARERLGKDSEAGFRTLAFGREAGLGDLRRGGACGDWRVKLLPAGHVLGSAMVRVEGGGSSLLYTGDFKLRAGLAAECCEPEGADILVMETTFGLPRYEFPPTDEVMARLAAFCREAIGAGEVPVLLAYALGKAQELVAGLGAAGLPVMLHRSVAAMTRVYEACGMKLPSWRVFDAGDVAGHVFICPPSAGGSRAIERIGRKRTAAVTGWAMDPGAVYRYGCDAAFPLSDHADYPDLLRMVEVVRPRKVLTLHGFAAEFARDLRARGIEAWAVGRENQLEFTGLVKGLGGRPK